MAEIIPLQRVAAAAREAVLGFIETVKAVFGEDLVSLTVYGAAVGEGAESGGVERQRWFHKGQGAHRPAQTVLVLRRVQLEALRRLAARGRELERAGIAAPLILTPEFLARSLDTFPLELIEIQQQHATVLGEDSLAGLVFDDAAIARQCERELKTILIGMHQRLLSSRGDERQLQALSEEACEQVVRTLRGLLWLKGRREARPAAAALAAAEEVFGRKLPGITAAMGSAPQGWATFQAIYEDVAALGRAADAF